MDVDTLRNEYLSKHNMTFSDYLDAYTMDKHFWLWNRLTDRGFPMFPIIKDGEVIKYDAFLIASVLLIRRQRKNSSFSSN